jgi:glucose-1-phosphate cytidylyltransferase
MMVIPAQESFHCVEVSEMGEVKAITPVSELPIRVNGGYFVLSQEVFDYLPPGGDLVADACGTLAGEGKLYGYRYDGFWKPADTFKERAELDAGYHRGDRPWMVWEDKVESTNKLDPLAVSR